jgi:hypothetical protein
MLTPFEVLWKKIVFPLLQAISLDDPWMRVVGGVFDYSAFARFNMPIPDYMRPHVRNPGLNDGTGLDLGKLFGESLAFPDSKGEPGLQLADIVASALTKAMNGKLPPEVFRPFGRVMVEKPHRESTVRMVALGDGPKVKVGDYHTYVLQAIRNRAKKMFVE